MFGRKCSLCNGKLDSNNICKECGLDNTKSDKYYMMNRSSCDNKPLTHVHEDDWLKEKKNVATRKRAGKSSEQPQYSYQHNPLAKKPEKRKQDKEKRNKISILVTILILVIGAIPSALGIFENATYSSTEPEYSIDIESYDPYEFLEQEHPLDGDVLSYTLTSGQYIVGVHIAPGDYYAEVNEDYDSVEVTDHANGIYLYEYPAKEEMDYLDDLRLFEGAIVTIISKEGIDLHTKNGQTGAMQSMAENFITDSYKLESNHEAAAGVTFEPGIYDIVASDDFSYVNLTIYDEYGAEWDYRGFDLGKDGAHGVCFRNVVIPEGAIISCEESNVELVPSEWIWTTDYMEHYY